MSADATGSRVAIVTAAADGIGAATALAFAAAGYRVAMVDVDASGLERTAGPAGDPDRVATFVTDVTDEAAVNEMVAAVVARFGRVDALVNVVGGSRPGKTVLDLPLAEWQTMLALNLTSTFLCCKAALPHLEREGGAIVNISSGAGVRGMKANPGYVAAKAGVVGLTKALAIDHGGMILGQLLHRGDGSALHSSALPSAAVEPPASGANRDAFLFGDMAGHGVVDGLKIEPTITADAAHPPAHVAGHEAVIDPGHDASMTSAVVSFLTADHLLFT